MQKKKKIGKKKNQKKKKKKMIGKRENQITKSLYVSIQYKKSDRYIGNHIVSCDRKCL